MKKSAQAMRNAADPRRKGVSLLALFHAARTAIWDVPTLQEYCASARKRNRGALLPFSISRLSCVVRRSDEGPCSHNNDSMQRACSCFSRCNEAAWLRRGRGAPCGSGQQRRYPGVDYKAAFHAAHGQQNIVLSRSGLDNCPIHREGLALRAAARQTLSASEVCV